MYSLERIFEIVFDDRRISDKEMQVISGTHIESLSINNVNNQYDEMIAETTAKHNAFSAAISLEDTTIAIRIGSTLTVDQIMNDFRKNVNQSEGTIKGIFGKNSAAYKEFFPRGTREYQSATKTNIEVLVDRVINVANKFADSLPATFISNFTNLKTQYVNARKIQLEKKESVVSENKETQDLRKALNIQIQKNILQIALNNIGNPEVFRMYININLLPKSHKKEVKPAAPVQPETQQPAQAETPAQP